MEVEQREWIVRFYFLVNQYWKELLDKTKSFLISKSAVLEAYRRVKANKGAAGCDGQSIEDFEKDLENNLYKIWNRMSSGSYFPPPVKRVEIPKDDGRTRPLGIPTVSDRIAQMVVKLHLEPELEKCFHPDSFGYRPGKSATQAVELTRKRCWEYDWVIDLDIKGFFDNINHHRMMLAVKWHTQERWILLHIERWLKASVLMPDGGLLDRDTGTPQGGVISPLLANLFLHYAFDMWLSRNFPYNPFERYADDAIIHCQTEEEALRIKEALTTRLLECCLELHPDKTKIVYCKDDNRRGLAKVTQFDFLGFTFRMRTARNQYKKTLFNSFSPAISLKSKRKIKAEIKSWKVYKRSDLSIFDISKFCNPKIRGWIGYYGKFYQSELYMIFKQFNTSLFHWASRKYKKLKGSKEKFFRWLKNFAGLYPDLFRHWRLRGVWVSTVQ
jgi:RNA-directed DNA polymerase